MKDRNKQSVRVRGASRQRSTGRSSSWPQRIQLLRLWLRNGVLISGLIGGVYIGWMLTASWINKPVSSVKINGEFSRIERQQVADRVYAAMGDSYIKLDLEAVQTSLLQEAWIDAARVERRWPDQLEVTVIEHKPIARWGKLGVLNQRGELIALKKNQPADEEIQKLPVLFGSEGMELEVMAQYQVIAGLLKEKDLVLKSLICDDTRSWSLSLQDGVEVVIGRDQLTQRVKRFLQVYNAQLHSRWENLEKVDLRYFNGLAAQWRESVSA